MSKAPTRASTTRAATTRATVQATVFDPTSDQTFLDLPAEVLAWARAHKTRYEWKRGRVRGRIDHENISRLQQEQWSPVPIDRHPELSGAKWPGADTPQWVERQGLILCERPEHVCQAVEAATRRKTIDITRAKQAELGMGTHKDIPRSGYSTDQPQIEMTVESPTGAVLSSTKAGIERGTKPDGTPVGFPAD
jgi:hypothetical protein